MAHTPHELGAVFRKDADILHNLKMSDAHFVRLSDNYHEVNREIHRIDSEVDAASDERKEMLKKERLALLDEITAIVNRARASAG
jgi:uncharacterized protein YdcH (DUF465 family)